MSVGVKYLQSVSSKFFIIMYHLELTLENGLTVRNIENFHYKFFFVFFSIFVERYLVTFLILLSY
jgi:hypothetical protein